MASLINEVDGRWRVELGPRDKRKRLRLGELSEGEAKVVHERIERLFVAQKYAQAISADLLQWLADLAGIENGRLYDKLVDLDLGVPPRRPTSGATLGTFLDDYSKNRVDVKPATKEVWRQVIKDLKIISASPVNCVRSMPDMPMLSKCTS